MAEMTDERALKALQRHKRPADSYRVTPLSNDEFFDGLIQLELTISNKTQYFTGDAQGIFDHLQAVAGHIKLRYLDPREED